MAAKEIMEQVVFDPQRWTEREFSFPGGTAHLSVRQDAAGPVLAIHLPYAGAYGMGEKYNALNQKGRRVVNEVEERFCNQGDKTYCPAPFFFTDSGFGLYADTLKTTVFDFADEILVSLPVKTLLLFFGGTPAQIISAYMARLGKPGLPPKWAFGPWISANRWQTQAQVEEQIDLLEKYRFPATVLVMEAWSDEATFYVFNGAKYEPKGGDEAPDYRDFDFSQSDYWQDPRGTIERLHRAGLHLVLWQCPVYKKLEEGRPPDRQHENDRDYVVQNRLCVMDAAGKPYTIPPGHWFEGSMIPDFTNPETRRLWFAKRRYLLDIGVDGFKTDGGEFIYREDLVFHNGAEGREMKNGYAQRYIAAYRDFLPPDRILFSRAGFAGQHTTPILWAGDQQSTFEELGSQLRAGLSAALSGIIFWGFDIAGFAGPLPQPELYLRATQLACFCPIMQWHSEPEGGQFGGEQSSPRGGGYGAITNERSPWNIAAAYGDTWEHDPADTGDNSGMGFLDRIRFWHQLRMKLLPYLYSEARHCVETLAPLLRPLVYDHIPHKTPGGDPCLIMEDQFMLGRTLLVAPVLERGVRNRSVWLPQGEWFGLFDDQPYTGGQWIETACGRGIPVFAKAGTALAVNPGDDGDGWARAGDNPGKVRRGPQFRLYGETGETRFRDDQGNDMTLYWDGKEITQTGKAAPCATVRIPR
ncbi:MAG: glycoside hydrolase [Treponema sp.]|jgi:alpha-D-xyloside xylohydrolase|nr:glycoside hydrolase [Treponema sp.]